jgi:hypothetical protein
MTPPEPFTEDPEMDQLARELRAERAEPDPEFAAALDRWAAAGFPRAQRPGHVPGRLERAWARVSSVPPRRLIAPVGAAATLIVVVGLAISQVDVQSGDDDSDAGGVAITQQDTGDTAESAAPAQAGLDELRESGGSGGDGLEPLQAKLSDGAQSQAIQDGGAAAKAVRGRHIAQTADLVLAIEPDGVREVADDVNAVVNTYNGFVITSSVSSGDADGGGLGAQFRMKIPARNLQAALAKLSELAHVQSRTEGTDDITGRFISAQERIEENEAARASLLKQRANAITQEEIDSLDARIRAVNNQLSIAREELAEAEQREQLVPVTVSIVAEEGADEDGDWSISDALDDAGEVLSTTAGIVLVAGAVLLPLALVALIFALVWRTRAIRGRERALDE